MSTGEGGGDKDPLSSMVVLRVTRQEKAAWVKAAQPRTLAAWIREGLNLLAEAKWRSQVADKSATDWRSKRE